MADLFGQLFNNAKQPVNEIVKFLFSKDQDKALRRKEIFSKALNDIEKVGEVTEDFLSQERIKGMPEHIKHLPKEDLVAETIMAGCITQVTNIMSLPREMRAVVCGIVLLMNEIPPTELMPKEDLDKLTKSLDKVDLNKLAKELRELDHNTKSFPKKALDVLRKHFGEINETEEEIDTDKIKALIKKAKGETL